MKNIVILKNLFWDRDINFIDIEKHKIFIIERILKYGLPEQVLWLLSTYPEQSIVEVIKKSKNIDKKTANYWAVHFQIPKKEILCFKRLLMQEYFC